MPILGVGPSGGIIPPYVIVPMTGPTAVIPARRIGMDGGIPSPAPIQSTGVLPPAQALPDRGLPIFSGLATVVNARTRSYVWPPVGIGEGYNSRFQQRVAQLDLINGMDRTLGKHGPDITRSAKRQQGQKIYGKLTTREALGRLTGRMERMYL